MAPIQLTDDEAQALTTAMQQEVRAQQDADAARLLLVWRNAADAKSQLLARLGEIHGFASNVPMAFNPETRTLTPQNGNGNG